MRCDALERRVREPYEMYGERTMQRSASRSSIFPVRKKRRPAGASQQVERRKREERERAGGVRMRSGASPRLVLRGGRGFRVRSNRRSRRRSEGGMGLKTFNNGPPIPFHHCRIYASRRSNIREIIWLYPAIRMQRKREDVDVEITRRIRMRLDIVFGKLSQFYKLGPGH